MDKLYDWYIMSLTFLLYFTVSLVEAVCVAGLDVLFLTSASTEVIGKLSETSFIALTFTLGLSSLTLLAIIVDEIAERTIYEWLDPKNDDLSELPAKYQGIPSNQNNPFYNYVSALIKFFKNK